MWICMILTRLRKLRWLIFEMRWTSNKWPLSTKSLKTTRKIVVSKATRISSNLCRATSILMNINLISIGSYSKTSGWRMRRKSTRSMVSYHLAKTKQDGEQLRINNCKLISRRSSWKKSKAKKSWKIKAATTTIKNLYFLWLRRRRSKVTHPGMTNTS